MESSKLHAGESPAPPQSTAATGGQSETTDQNQAGTAIQEPATAGAARVQETSASATTPRIAAKRIDFFIFIN